MYYSHTTTTTTTTTNRAASSYIKQKPHKGSRKKELFLSLASPLKSMNYKSQITHKLNHPNLKGHKVSHDTSG